MMNLREAIDRYLGPHRSPAEDVCDDLVAAGRVAHEWRTVGPQATAIVLHAMHRHCGKSHRQIEAATGISQGSVQRLIHRLESGEWGEYQY